MRAFDALKNAKVSAVAEVTRAATGLKEYFKVEDGEHVAVTKEEHDRLQALLNEANDEYVKGL